MVTEGTRGAGTQRPGLTGAGEADWAQPAGPAGCRHILRTRRRLEVFDAGKWMASTVLIFCEDHRARIGKWVRGDPVGEDGVDGRGTEVWVGWALGR